MDFTWEVLDSANENLKTLQELSRKIVEYGEVKTSDADSDAIGRFSSALSDDLNTSEALAVFLGYVKQANQKLDDTAIATLLAMDAVVGVIEPLMRGIESEEIPANVKDLAEQREKMRTAGDFEKADVLRGEIEALGYTVEDTPSGPRIRSV
jgi:cysteinyl-tRNA synthetase